MMLFCVEKFLLLRPGAADIVGSLLSHSCVEAGTTGLNCLDLGFSPCHTLEAPRKLGAVEEGALSSLNRAERGSRRSADVASRELGALVQRAVLLGLLAVACEGIGKRLGGRCRVNLGSMVDLCCRMSATRANGVHRDSNSLLGVVRLPRKRIMG